MTTIPEQPDDMRLGIWAFAAVWIGIATLGIVMLCASAEAKTAVKPGVERWAVKTSVHYKLDAVPRWHSIESLLQVKTPQGVAHNDKRFAAHFILDGMMDEANKSILFGYGIHEGDLVQTVGYLHLVAYEPDGDFHVQLSASPTDDTECFIVEVPQAEACHDEQLKEVVTSVRASLLALTPRTLAPGSVVSIKPAIKVRVAGQFFMDLAHIGADGAVEARGKKGCKSPTLAELHPVTSIAVVE